MPRQRSEIPQPDWYSLEIHHQPYLSAEAVFLKSDIGFGFKLTVRTSGINYIIVLNQTGP